MSIAVLNEAWKVKDLTITQKFVLVVLADLASPQEATAHPSVGYIADVTCISERAVQYALRDLEDKGLIRVQQREGRSSLYRLSVGSVDGHPQTGGQGGASPAPPTRKGGQQVQGGVQLTAQTGASPAPITTTNGYLTAPSEVLRALDRGWSPGDEEDQEAELEKREQRERSKSKAAEIRQNVLKKPK